MDFMVEVDFFSEVFSDGLLTTGLSTAELATTERSRVRYGLCLWTSPVCCVRSGLFGGLKCVAYLKGWT